MKPCESSLGASKMRAEGLQLNTNTSEVKCAHLGQEAPCTIGEVILQNTQSSMLPGNFFLVMLAALTWASSMMSVSEHVYQFYGSHSPFSQLVDWTDPATVIFANDSEFAPEPQNRNRLILSSEELHLIFPRDLNHVLFAQDIVTFVFPLKFYKITELLIV